MCYDIQLHKDDRNSFKAATILSMPSAQRLLNVFIISQNLKDGFKHDEVCGFLWIKYSRLFLSLLLEFIFKVNPQKWFQMKCAVWFPIAWGITHYSLGYSESLKVCSTVKFFMFSQGHSASLPSHNNDFESIQTFIQQQETSEGRRVLTAFYIWLDTPTICIQATLQYMLTLYQLKRSHKGWIGDQIIHLGLFSQNILRPMVAPNLPI